MDSAEAGRDDRAAGVEEVERLRQVLDDEAQRHLRLRADFENLHRRLAQERDAARQDGRRAALLPVLSVLDTLERALAAGSSDPDFYEGVAATHRLFIRALREAGAEAVESVGRAFDPQVHEAVATVPSSGVEPGTVAREVRRGWRVGNELLRPAQVVVATDPEPAEWR
jgi:molecular chaperone GrpE